MLSAPSRPAHANLIPADPAAPSFTAADVLRGLGRYAVRHGMRLLCEVPLPNGRRADAVLLDARGGIMIVEVKVSRADLLGDVKWIDYLDWCDRFCWALPPVLDPAPLDAPERLPARSGYFVADRYDAALLRIPAEVPMSPARRRSEHLRLSRLAMYRLMAVDDPELLAAARPSDIGL
jgi:hypothetical protein